MSDLGASFQAAYGRLNPAQKQAVDTIEGPVMVIAGPGTGKTQILTLRIANILRMTDTPPSGILALTFTEAGVHAMRKRLVELIGSRGYHVEIYTFHAFCNELIRRYPDAFPRIIGSSAMTDIDKVELVEEALRSLTLKRLKPSGDPTYYLKPLISAISDLKREHVSVARAHELAKEKREAFEAIPDKVHEKGPHKGKVKGVYLDEEKRLEKNEELVLVYEKYEELLRERALYDFDDMIVESVSALESDPDLLLRVQEEYLYLLADEHQDANNSQNRLLELLASFHDAPNLFLVGDAKQAIYRFQGASLENFLYFKQRYPNANLITLTDNYRSAQGILDSSYSLIEKGELAEGELREPLTAHLAGQEEQVTVASFTEAAYEHAYVARSIRDLLDQGVPPEEIALLYRTNGEAEALTPALERLGIPYVIESDTNALSDEALRAFVDLLRASVDMGKDELVTPLLFAPFLAVDPLDAYHILRRARNERASLVMTLADEAQLRAVGVTQGSPVYDLVPLLRTCNQAAHSTGLLAALDTIAHTSGFVAYLASLPDARERIEAYRALLASAQSLVEVRRSSRLEDFVRYLGLLETHGLSVKQARLRVRTPRVRLMTAHRAKGLEFDYVFIVRAVDGVWGNRRASEHFSLIAGSDADATNALDDERRLFYVALTRARHGVTITYPVTALSGRALLPCQFITEIDEAHVHTSATEAFESSLSPTALIAHRTTREVPLTDLTFLRETFLEQGLSVTAFNTYLKDPWEYFFTSLLRVPQPPAPHLLYGNAIHGSLRDHFEAVREGGDASVERALERFRFHLSRAPLAQDIYEELLERGMEHLRHYLEAHLDDGQTVFATELSITGQLRITDELVIPLRGILDRVDILPSGSFVVVDYKTGTPKSRNHILGKTKGRGAGDYYRQLTFYALLLKQYEEGAHPCARGELAFVEPTKQGVLKPHEVFEPSDDEVEQLKREVSRVAGEIYDLAFWDTPCDPETCSYCPLVDALKARESS